MGDYQKIVLVGNATKDAEAKTAKDTDTPYTTFRLGVKDAKGRSSYFPVVVFGRSRDSVAEYVRKGRQVLVEGRIDVGTTGRASVVADRVVFLGAPAAGEKREAAGRAKLRAAASTLKPE
jgi:single-stranded DNA-binding protein